MYSPVRIAVVDDHPLYLEGLERTLRGYRDVEIVASGRTAEDACRIAVSQKPDVLLLDIGIPGDGITALRTITRSAPSVRVVMLTASDNQEHVTEAMEIGAKGYILKGVDGDDLMAALRSVLNEKVYLAPRSSAHSPAQTADIDRAEPQTKPETLLSIREREILRLLSEGLTNKEISYKIHLPMRAVRACLATIFEKTGVRNRVEAMLYFKGRH